MTIDQAKLAENHSKVLREIQSYTEPGDSRQPQLIAVSKKQPDAAVRAAFALGQTLFGENYAQELADKANALQDLDLRWIFIGHIQSNKIRKIVTHAAEIQTVASFDHAKQIARHARELHKAPYPIYLEVNAGDEASKSGLARDAVLPLAERIEAELPDLKLMGLMAIPPDTYSDSAWTEVPPLYRDLRALADQVGAAKLSLGMSNDLRIALRAGSDFVRVGTAIFGRRS